MPKSTLLTPSYPSYPPSFPSVLLSLPPTCTFIVVLFSSDDRKHVIPIFLYLTYFVLSIFFQMETFNDLQFTNTLFCADHIFSNKTSINELIS